MAAQAKFDREEVDIRLRPNRRPDRSQPLVPWWMRIERMNVGVAPPADESTQRLGATANYERLSGGVWSRRCTRAMANPRRAHGWRTPAISRAKGRSWSTKRAGGSTGRAAISISIARVREWEKGGDELMWRFIVSPEDADRMDLKEHIRELARTMEADLGTPAGVGCHRPQQHRQPTRTSADSRGR